MHATAWACCKGGGGKAQPAVSSGLGFPMSDIIRHKELRQRWTNDMPPLEYFDICEISEISP